MINSETKKTFCDIYVPLRSEYRFLSPLYGVIWCHNEIAEKYYRFLGADHSLSKIAHYLFYRTDLVEFDISKETKNPFTWFSISTIAHVMAFLSKQNFIDDDIYKLYNKIRDEKCFGDAITRQHHQSIQIRQLCNSVLKQFENTKRRINTEEQKLLSFEKKLKEQKKILNTTLQQAENITEEHQEKIFQLRSEITSLKKDKKILNKNLVKSKEEQISSINAKILLQEEYLMVAQQDAMFHAGLLQTWQHTLEDIEYIKSLKDETILHTKYLMENFTNTTIEQLINEGFSPDFINQHLPVNKYHRYLPRRVQDYINIHCIDLDCILTELYNLCDLLINTSRTIYYREVINLLNAALWLKCKGDFRKLTNYLAELKVLNKNLFANNLTAKDNLTFPHLCHEYYSREVYDRYFPPLCITKTCRPTPNSEISFSDCGESSLRNFINVLIKNHDSSQLDAKILQNSGLNIDPRIIAFYEKNSSLEKIKHLDVHNQWAEITSSLNTKNNQIKYLTPGKSSYCELAAGGNNMLKVLEVLLGETNIATICRHISLASGIDIFCDLSNFHPEKNDLEDYTNFVRLEFNKKYVFYWYFLKQHFRCASTDTLDEEKKYVSHELDSLSLMVRQSVLDGDQFRALLSFHLKEKTITQVKGIFDSLDMAIVGDEMTFLMLGKLNSIDSMFDYCMFVLTIPELVNTQKISAAITAIIKGISPHPVIFEQKRNLINRIREVGTTHLIDLADAWEKESLEKE